MPGPLLLSRQFAPLFWCQFFAAFNDNFLKTALVFVILFHSGGPGANGKSLSTLSFRSELRAGANGIIGAIGSAGAALGLLVFPLLKEGIGLGPTFLILSVVPLVAFIICSIIKWDPTRTAISPDEEQNAPQFKSDAAAQAAAAEASVLVAK